MDRRAVLIALGATGLSTKFISHLGIAEAFDDHGADKGAKAPAAKIHQAQSSLGSISIKPVPLGGGGFVTGIDISNDGDRFVCRTDVCNAYVRDRRDPSWKPIFSPDTMLEGDWKPRLARNKKADGEGVAAIRIAPSDKNVIYASYLGYVWRSTDGGRSVRRTRLPQLTMLSNAGRQRLYNRAIDIHPLNASDIIVGTWGDGAWHSADGGAAWQQLRLPAAIRSFDDKPGLSLVLFDPVDGRDVYVFVTGVGLFHSSSGAAGDFVACPGGPVDCSNLVSGRDGSVWLCGHTRTADAPIWNYRPRTGWTSSKPPYEMRVLAVDPRNSEHLLASNGNGFMVRSVDRGATWKKASGSWSRNGGEVAWVGGLDTFFPGQMLFDPKEPDVFWVGQGVGVCRAGPVTGNYHYRDWSAGIEELCPVAAVSVPGGKTFLSALDKPFWRLDDEVSYNNNFRYPRDPSQKHSENVVIPGAFIDYAGDNPKFLVGVIGSSGTGASRLGPGFTADGGDNWFLFEGTPPRGWGFGGCIAASTTKNFVLLPSNNGVGCFTLDGGRSWESVRLDGVNETAKFTNAFYVVRKNITADKTRPGVFALVYTVMQPGPDPYGNPLGGVWLTRDGGRNWSQMLKGIVNNSDHSHGAVPMKQDNRQYWQCQLEYVPGFTAELLYTPYSDFEDRLWWSKDDGQSWSEPNSSVRNVRCFGFGRPAPGSNRPALYFRGTVDGKAGVFVSFDWLRSKPSLISEQPSPLLADIISVTGDPNRFGRVYLGAAAAGWLIADVALAGMAGAGTAGSLPRHG